MAALRCALVAVLALPQTRYGVVHASRPTAAPTTDDACPEPTARDCAGGLRDSVLIEASATGGLSAGACPGAARYLRPDPITGAILEICGPPPGGSNATSPSARALPVARCGEARIGGLAVDGRGEALYYATGGAIRRAALTGEASDVEVAGAFATVVVRGLNFGASEADFLGLELRGVACAAAALTYVDETEVRCVTADPSLAGPTASPLPPACAEVETRDGGRGSSLSPTVAAYRRAEKGAMAAPAIFSVDIENAYALRTRAAAVDDADAVYFSSLGSDDGDVFGGILRLREGALRVVLAGAPRITGLAIEDGWLYYADAGRSLVFAAARNPTFRFEGGCTPLGFFKGLVPLVLIELVERARRRDRPVS